MAKARKKAVKKEKAGSSYILKISLLDIKPLIWRRIQLPADS